MFDDDFIDIPQPKDKGILLKDILEDEVDSKYFLSEKIIKGFLKHKERNDRKGNGFGFSVKDVELKSNCLDTKEGSRANSNFIITNSTQPRNGKGSGGKGHLSKTDQKSYCLDTGNSQGIEIIGYLNDNKSQSNRIYNPNGKSSTLVGNAGGGGAKTGLYQIKSNIRRLTPREAGRLQSVPEHILNLMLTSGTSDTQLYKMFGNGWNIEVIKHILSHI